MSKPKESGNKPSPNFRPATTIEGREQQLISLAFNLVEERLRNGTATSQETTHFLKLGSTKERLEREMLEKQNALLAAKTEAIQEQKRVEELYTNAINSFREYRGEQNE